MDGTYRMFVVLASIYLLGVKVHTCERHVQIVSERQLYLRSISISVSHRASSSNTHSASSVDAMVKVASCHPSFLEALLYIFAKVLVVRIARTVVTV